MNNWVESWATGGRTWTAKGTKARRQIAIVIEGEKWTIASVRLINGQLEKADFRSRAPGEAGLEECLAWLAQLLLHTDDPAFDPAEAKRTLLN